MGTFPDLQAPHWVKKITYDSQGVLWHA